jgi:hypothetical protein
MVNPLRWCAATILTDEALYVVTRGSIALISAP